MSVVNVDFRIGSLAPRPSSPTASLAWVAWAHIERVVADCGGNISEAARRLDIARRTLQLKRKKNPPRW
jgi:two-component system response regulator RegA